MASSHLTFQVNCCKQKSSFSHSSAFKPFLGELHQLSMRSNVSKTIKDASMKLLDVFVDRVFEITDQPLLPSQSNFAPVDELREAALITRIEGKIPDDFPEGVYIRNGSNPLFGGLKSTKSIFGRSSHMWVEGEGMLHALYFDRGTEGTWTVVYNNRHVETETFLLEKRRNKLSFLPAAEGDSLACLSAAMLNKLRFGKMDKHISNTSVFEHSGKFYAIAENSKPQEINIFTLENLGTWDVDTTWNRCFTSHPKRAPGTGELVIMGMRVTKPFLEVGIISANGNQLLQKVDINLNRCTFSHEIGVTLRYNVILDFPLTVDKNRVVLGGPLVKYEHEGYARIGVMPRYGDANSIKWFNVKSNCTFHLLNCFEDGDEVVALGCRAFESIIPGPDFGSNKFEWFARKLRHIDSVEASVDNRLLFTRLYEWRLNMQTGEVKERNLTGKKFSMDFPMINADYAGIKNKYGYTQIADSTASSASGMPKFGGLAKLYLEEPDMEEPVKVEYHKFEENVFCTGATFVSRGKQIEEDDGWIVTYVHNEDTNTSQVYIIDTKKFASEPVAKITLPFRVPYGFHGAFMPIPLKFSESS